MLFLVKEHLRLLLNGLTVTIQKHVKTCSFPQAAKDELRKLQRAEIRKRTREVERVKH